MSFCRRAALVALLAFPWPSFAQAQPATHQTSVPVGSVVPADVMRDLPLGDSVYALIETTQSEVISDRFNSGGLNIGGDTRLGGFLGSWSQTRFRVGDIDISDPMGGGAALLFPDTAFWGTVRVTTGLMPVDLNTPGLGIGLEPRRAGSSWQRLFTGTLSRGGLAVKAPAGQPIPIARLNDALQGSAVVSGPLSPRASLVVAGTLGRGSSYRREVLPTTTNQITSGFAHLVFAPDTTREWRVLGLVQKSERPFEYWSLFRDAAASTANTALHIQTTYESHAADAAQWRVFGGYTRRDRQHAIGPSTLFVERIVDGPVTSLVDAAADTLTARLSGGARLTPHVPSGSARHLEYGVDVDYAATTSSNLFAGTVRESVNSFPARIWSYNAIAGDPFRTTLTSAAFAQGRFDLSPRVSLDAAVRGEFVHGGADGAATTVNWLTLLPHAYVRLAFSDRRTLTLGYNRTANTLTHNWLAFGDPAAPTARVVSTAAPNTVVARVGPGINGNTAFSGIATDVKRPYTDELVVGWEKRRSASTRYTLTGIARWEHNMLGVVNTGVGASAYAPVALPDAGKDLIDPADDRTLVIYNRLPSSFGLDRYLVTNPEQQAARAFGLRMSLEHSSDRLFLLFGATASAAQGSGGNRGYGPLENDQDQPGELFTNPNAASYSYGRLFADRAFTIKWTTLYRFPGDFSIGGIARYQDGQPFSRMVVLPNLNQGVEAVQAYPNAGSRFTFTGTLDLRAQKGIPLGTGKADLIFDAYNLFTRNNEVEEYVVNGNGFRTPTAIQPPRVLHLGLRLTF
ncbi:MAG: hypothetical protein U0Q55_03780 [Vicinamibacterales bacterium]